MATTAAVDPVRGDHDLRGLRRRRLRRRLLGPRRRRDQARRTTPRGHRPLDRPGLGGQPRLADLRVRAAVDLLPGGVRLDHADPVRPADARRARASCCAAPSFAFRKAVFRTRDRRNFGAAFAHLLGPGALLLRRRGRRHRLRAGPGRGQGRRPVGQLGQPHLRPRRACSPSASTAYLAAFFLVRDADRLSDETMVAYFRRRATAAAVAAGLVAVVGIFVLSNDAEYLFDGLTSRALPAGDPLRRVRPGRARAGRPRHPARRPPGRRRRGGQPSSWRGAWRSGTTCCPESLTVSAGRRAVGHHHRRAGRHRTRRGPDRARPSCCSTCSTRRRCCPRRACPSQHRDREATAHSRGRRHRPHRPVTGQPPAERADSETHLVDHPQGVGRGRRGLADRQRPAGGRRAGVRAHRGVDDGPEQPVRDLRPGLPDGGGEHHRSGAGDCPGERGRPHRRGLVRGDLRRTGGLQDGSRSGRVPADRSRSR